MLEPNRVNLAIFLFFLTVEIWLLENPKKHITFSHFEIIFSQVTKSLPGKKKLVFSYIELVRKFSDSICYGFTLVCWINIHSNHIKLHKTSMHTLNGTKNSNGLHRHPIMAL
jgi:hypothetical protein